MTVGLSRLACDGQRGAGRFAPSPSGDLHLGSLYTALASYCQARAQGDRWLIRIEDADLPRNVPDAATAILATLTRFGLLPDEPARYQTDHFQQYEQALYQLQQAGLVYGCVCSRQQLKPYAVYPGFCRHRQMPLAGHAVRLRVPEATVILFDDQIQGQQQQALATEVGDFVLRRRDGIWSYQLAVVVDDALAGVTEIVRGHDLLDNTGRQIYLQQCLGLLTPRYAHLPLLYNAEGQKLSKQNLARSVALDPVIAALRLLLEALGQSVPQTAPSVQQLLTAAIADWDLGRIPAQARLPDVYT